MEKTHVSKKPKFFYGWWIVAAGFFCLFIQSGFAYYAFSLFVKPLQGAFGWGRGAIMLGLTIYLAIQGLAAPFIGRFVDRYGVKKIMFIGALITGIGFVLVSQAHNLGQFYAFYTVLGLGAAGMSQIPVTYTISNWFRKRRGMAVGLASTGMGAGGFFLAPLIGGYLIPHFGTGVAYLVLGMLTWVLIIPLALFVVKTKPADIGLYPDNAEATETVAGTKASLSAPRGMSLKMAAATSAFWLIFVASLLGQFGHVGVLQNQVPHLQDIGYPVATASAALATTALGSLIGKFVFGWLCDHIKPKYAYAIGMSLKAIGIIILLGVGPTSPVTLIYLYAIILGVGVGSFVPCASMLVSDTFGLASYGAIYGLVTLAQSTGSSTSPLLAGYMYDAMGTYHVAFTILLSLFAIAIPAILMVRRPKSAA